MMRRPPLSLKARAVQWLAQREHSEIELRSKLLRAAQQQLLSDRVQARDATADADATSRTPRTGVPETHDAAATRATLSARIDAVIVWLRSRGYLDDNRFVESRVHARSAGHGTARIRQELAQHGLALPADTAAALRASECERAAQVRARHFGEPGEKPLDLKEQARQARFLLRRGFPGDVVAKVLRPLRRSSGREAEQG